MKSNTITSNDKLETKKRSVKNYLPYMALSLAIGIASFAGFYTLATGHKAQAASCPVQACVSLDSQKSDPIVLTVTNGSYVQFNSTDGKKHNIALEHSAVQHEDETEYESGDFGGGEAWKVQFKKDGAYTFRDKYNSDLTINVVAYTVGKDYKVQ